MLELRIHLFEIIFIIIDYQKSPFKVLVTWATVCSAMGMSSLRKSTLLTTDEGSASKIILKLEKIDINTDSKL